MASEPTVAPSSPPVAAARSTPSRFAQSRGEARAAAAWSDLAIVWLPWLAAPVFFALPIGGCGVGERLRQAAARPLTARAPGRPDVTLVTFEGDDAGAEPQGSGIGGPRGLP